MAFKTANEGDDVIMDDPATLPSTSSENLDLETHGKFSYIFNFFNFFLSTIRSRRKFRQQANRLT